MHQCNQDPLAVSYPDGVWFRENQKFLIVGIYTVPYTGLLLGVGDSLSEWTPDIYVQGSVGRAIGCVCLSVCHQINLRRENSYVCIMVLFTTMLPRERPLRVFPCFFWCKHWWLVWPGATFGDSSGAGCGYLAQENSSPCCHSNELPLSCQFDYLCCLSSPISSL